MKFLTIKACLWIRPTLSFGDDIVVKLSCIRPADTSWEDLFPTLDNTKEQVPCQQAEQLKGKDTSRGKRFLKIRLLIDGPSLRNAAMTKLQTLKMINFGTVFYRTLQCSQSPPRVSI